MLYVLDFDIELRENGCLFSHENCFPCKSDLSYHISKICFWDYYMGSRDTACNVLVRPQMPAFSTIYVSMKFGYCLHLHYSKTSEQRTNWGQQRCPLLRGSPYLGGYRGGHAPQWWPRWVWLIASCTWISLRTRH